MYNSSSAPASPPKRDRALKRGFNWAITYLAVIWIVHLLVILTGGYLRAFGVHPLDLSSLPFIFTSPFLHLNFAHLISNSIPGALFIFLIGISGNRVVAEVTLFTIVIGGLGTWLTGGPGTNHIGASELVYGWLAYLIIRGIFNRHFGQVALGIVLAFSYAGYIWGMFPNTPGISWQAHLFGAIGGLVAGAVITSDDPIELIQKREQKRLGQRLM
ncbi:rhomboid family intramembrane serine protease [Corynebacterium sp. H130]|uniref:rhomboid family intramembrane serine protease n=1 Tax=Corynebacterium sp. H130 TaxID=3133444 RepID=UPI0030A2A310